METKLYDANFNETDSITDAVFLSSFDEDEQTISIITDKLNEEEEE